MKWASHKHEHRHILCVVHLCVRTIPCLFIHCK